MRVARVRRGEDGMVVKKLEDVKLEAGFTSTTIRRAIRMSSSNDNHTQNENCIDLSQQSP